MRPIEVDVIVKTTKRWHRIRPLEVDAIVNKTTKQWHRIRPLGVAAIAKSTKRWHHIRQLRWQRLLSPPSGGIA